MIEIDAPVAREVEVHDLEVRKPRVGYLINQYPKVSHTFIRREIIELERQGFYVYRYAMRGFREKVVDDADALELQRTAYLVQGSYRSLISDLIQVSVKRPRRFISALIMALRLGIGADRPLPYHLYYFAEACRLYLWMKRDGIEHLHAHFGTNPAEVAMLAGHIADVPYSFTVHGPEEFDKASAIYLSEKIRAAAFVVAVSSFGRSQLYRTIGFSYWSKIRVVHCALDSSFFLAQVRPVPVRPRLVCVGRLCEQKGQLLLIEAAQKLVALGWKFELVLAGDGEMRGEIEALVRKHNLESTVRITGWIDGAGVREEIQNARALVLPSFAEGLPVVLMEAMALGRPVITTWVAGIPELVISGECGWLCPPGDVDALVSAMSESLRTHVDDLQRMGQRARLRVAARHEITVEVTKLAKYLMAANTTEVT